MTKHSFKIGFPILVFTLLFVNATYGSNDFLNRHEEWLKDALPILEKARVRPIPNGHGKIKNSHERYKTKAKEIKTRLDSILVKYAHYRNPKHKLYDLLVTAELTQIEVFFYGKTGRLPGHQMRQSHRKKFSEIE